MENMQDKQNKQDKQAKQQDPHANLPTTALCFDNQGLFGSDGHLTQDGLQAMAQGQLDELGSLEAAEHLTYCDACLQRYTALLAQSPDLLVAPAKDAAPAVTAQLRMRSLWVFSNRYVTVAAAVLMAFGLWQFGAFRAPQRTAAEAPSTPSHSISISQGVSGAMQTVQNAVGSVFDKMEVRFQSGLDQISGQTTKQDDHKAEAALPHATNKE